MTDVAAQLVSLRRVAKHYKAGGAKYEVLREIDLDVEPGAYLALTGPSGSGKSTLLGIIGMLVVPDAGDVLVDGVRINEMTDSTRSRLRGRTFGFVFQAADLVPGLTVIENVLLPAQIAGLEVDLKWAHELLDRVGLTHRMLSFPSQLSGGEACRAALARAAINRPRVILADEPTGDLDRGSSDKVVQLLERLRTEGCALIVATHDESLAARAHRRLSLSETRMAITDTPRA